VTDGIPTALPALLLAGKIQRKAQAVGLAAPSAEQWRTQLAGGVGELGPDSTSDGVGQLLYTLVAVAAELGVDPEEALRAAALAGRDRIVELERSRRQPESTP
jgi:uncharacterized protein YabN with tetrapyrrole methylase and pyrophosphatase domain